MLITCITLLLPGMLISGCSTPSQRFHETALDYQFQESLIKGTPFLHRIYSNDKVVNDKHFQTLHIYLGGDGTPWRQGRWLSDDPTPRNPVTLTMMRADPAPSVLLGRPCYQGLNHSPHCHYKFWTSHRYSKTVVDSLTAAIHSFLRKYPYQELVLIGFSGGGTLALLVASNLKNILAVITVAANLDTESWSRLHGYPPLHHSLNPANSPPLPRSIRQFHFAGTDDDNVPVKIIKGFSDKQTNSRLFTIKNFNHSCCWAEYWNQLILRIPVEFLNTKTYSGHTD